MRFYMILKQKKIIQITNEEMLVIANNSAEINVNPRAEGEWVNNYGG